MQKAAIIMEDFAEWLLSKRKRPPPLLFVLLGLPSLMFLLSSQLSLLTSPQLIGTGVDLAKKVDLPRLSPPKLRRLLPTPILLVGMPKTGTTTIHSFFLRSGYRSSHYRCLDDAVYCGLCIKVAVQQGKPPLKTCGDYEVWTQMDIENLGQCHFPQIQNLEILHQEAPHATFVLTHRNMTNWARSVKNWVGTVRSMAARLSKCRGGPKSKQPEDLIQWHLEHIQRIRDFVQSHPSHTLVEINIEDPNAGEIMSQHFGVASPATNWGHDNGSHNSSASNLFARPG